MVRGVAPGAETWSFAAFTPVLITVPIRIPMARVKRTNANDRNLCLRKLSKKLIIQIYSYRGRECLYYTSGAVTPLVRCCRVSERFISTNKMPARIKSAPRVALRDSSSLHSIQENNHANTGSSE